MLRLIERIIFPLAVITGAIGLFYWYWTTTPAYSIGQIVSSIKERDIVKFEKYVDLEHIASKGIDDIVRSPNRSRLLGRMDSMLGIGIISFFKNEIVSTIRGEVLSVISYGEFIGPQSSARPAAMNSVNASAAPNPTDDIPLGDSGFAIRMKPKGGPEKLKAAFKEYGISKEGFRGVDYLKVLGNSALLGLKFHSPKLNRDFIVEFKLDDVGGYWRVTELSNINDLVQTYVDSKHQSSLEPAS